MPNDDNTTPVESETPADQPNEEPSVPETPAPEQAPPPPERPTDKGPSPDVPEQTGLNEKQLGYVQIVSARIMAITMCVVIILVILMSAQLWFLNQSPLAQQKPHQKPSNVAKTISGTNGVRPVAATEEITLDIAVRSKLEHDAQYLRTKRGQSLVAAKLFTHSLSIMAGILMMTMGSAFVFARIQTARSDFGVKVNGSKLPADASPEQVAAATQPRASLVFSSYSPGLFFAGFGTILIITALNTSVSNQITVDDAPVFLENLNLASYRQGQSTVRTEGGEYDPTKECEVIKSIGGKCDE